MTDIRYDDLPPALPADTPRVREEGKPTEALLEQEHAERNWFEVRAKDLDSRHTVLSETVDDATGTIENILNLEVGPDRVFGQRMASIAGKIGEGDGDTGTVQGLIENIEQMELTPGSALLGRFETIAAKIGAELEDAGTVQGLIQDIEQMDLTPGSALLARFEGIAAKIGANLGDTGTLQGDIEDVEGAVESLQTLELGTGTAFASWVAQATTKIGDDVASVGTYGESINGISVKYGIVGTINNVTGKFEFSGVQRNDGTVSFDLFIGANVEIDGNLVVNGTIITAKAAPNAFTRPSSAALPSAMGIPGGYVTGTYYDVAAGGVTLAETFTVDADANTVQLRMTFSGKLKAQGMTGGSGGISATLAFFINGTNVEEAHVYVKNGADPAFTEEDSRFYAFYEATLTPGTYTVAVKIKGEGASSTGVGAVSGSRFAAVVDLR